MRETIAVLVENRFGVLARVVDLFSTRGFNIDSLNVAETMDPAVSRMTIVVQGDEAVLEQVRKQLSKLVDTTKVIRFFEGDHVEREMLLAKVSTQKRGRPELMEIARLCRADIVDVGETFLTLGFMGAKDEIARLLELLKPFQILEIARTGPAALGRGK
ncbi:MAG: acetolactate synthase small subunit [Candidatus Hydrogenedentes bacterium]|nr:acetolactate synthase small subunit [Candidatus Hydrogenedentota bacterium]